MSYTEERVVVDRIGRRRVWPSVMDRLWARVDKSSGSDGCWLWTGACNPKGYGQVAVGGKRHQLVHRVVFQVTEGAQLPSDVYVLHSCDNPPCCNPAHLRAGTAAENSADMVARGRSGDTRNERSGKAKLTNAQVVAIRERWSKGDNPKDLGPYFGVHPAHISRIVHGLRRPVEHGHAAPHQRITRPKPPSVTALRIERERQECEAFWSRVVEMYQGGMPTTQIATVVGRDESNISRRLRRLGVLMRAPHSYKPSIDHGEVRRLHAQGVRAGEMCKRLGVGRQRLYTAFAELGLPRFGPGNPGAKVTESDDNSITTYSPNQTEGVPA